MSRHERRAASARLTGGRWLRAVTPRRFRLRLLSYLSGTLVTGGARNGDRRGSRAPANRRVPGGAGIAAGSGLSAARRLRLLRLGAAGFGAVLFGAVAAVGVPAAGAGAQEVCGGVVVVVDFGELDGLETGCAADPADGLDALAQAGFAVTEVAAIRGMVCSIDALPATDCGASPPADAYWSYWHANAGDEEWTYSMVGGADATPDAGDFEGWAFGDGSAPPAVAPPTPRPTPLRRSRIRAGRRTRGSSPWPRSP
nr:hypothetical protein GCM10025732_09490 [Glycomyces mayteni]